MGKRINRLHALIRSRRGKNLLIFLLFLVVSSILWIVQSLNEETQGDLRYKVVLTNVPDSLTRISPMPDAMNVSVRVQGTQLIKYMWQREPKMNIDFRQYKSGNNIIFSDAALKAFFRNAVGGGAQILSVTPDTLTITFTTQHGIELPVRVNSHVTTAPQYVLVGEPKSLVDSVKLFSLHGNINRYRHLNTAAVSLSHIEKSVVLKVPVEVPSGCRAVPDSVPVSITVEPLISKTRYVNVTPINVPAGKKLVTVPSKVEVFYMLPMSVYKKSNSEPKFKVVANYYDISYATDKIPVSLVESPQGFTNIFLSTDSVEYIIEQ